MLRGLFRRTHMDGLPRACLNSLRISRQQSVGAPGRPGILRDWEQIAQGQGTLISGPLAPNPLHPFSTSLPLACLTGFWAFSKTPGVMGRP